MSDSLERHLRALDARVGVLGLVASGAAVLAVLWMLGQWVSTHAVISADEQAALTSAHESLELDLAERQALNALVSRDVARAKASAATLSRSRKALFEGGLALSEEKRLLEKQLEIMSFWIRLEPEADKIHLMRGDQIVESLPLDGARPVAVGGEARKMPRSATLMSKERFASTERPKSEQVGGQLQWEPPQVGTSVRANALGQFVLFTKEGLVIHGPPLKASEHAAYPHLCLSLPLKVAARIYSKSFVGTKFILAMPSRP
ncbi:MAG: hypothetical protein COV48_12495 [Elusimicrobia bacterium CG11_big_fil_rev_8_21_14_0_20_64_6]|nr:MAG: hypothetical protein COV48_12495 [Elusimicrobia bacterium CG11_big_fil_rev_8_21_14_0_20_64_6]